uniref:Uncharacterized protein n=1 Tax=Arundo donax TaxID=35708 RepID=A0A0A9ALQ2_ARUDO
MFSRRIGVRVYGCSLCSIGYVWMARIYQLISARLDRCNTT